MHRKWLIRIVVAITLVLVALQPVLVDLHHPTGKIAVVSAIGAADYPLTGAHDNLQFQAALNSLPITGGVLQVVSAVTVNFDALTTVTRAIDNVTIIGTGRGTYFVGDGVTAIFTAGGNNWTFQNIRTNASGINMGATIGWSWENVTINATYYAYRTDDLTTGTSWNIPTGRTATYVIAASDAPANVKAQADYVCDAVNDEATVDTYLQLGNVELTVGNYNFDADLIISDSNRVLRGQGKNVTIVTASYDSVDYHLVISVAAGTSNITISDMTIDANATVDYATGTETDGVALSENLTFKNLRLVNGSDDTISISGNLNNVLVTECDIYRDSGKEAGRGTWACVEVEGLANNITIVGNYISYSLLFNADDILRYGAVSVKPHGVNYPSNVIIDKNIIDTRYRGILAYAPEIQITNNHIEDKFASLMTGILSYTQAPSCLITGNTIAAAYFGMDIQSSFNVISNNFIEVTQNNGVGILLNGGGKNNIVSNGLKWTSGVAAIAIQSLGSSNHIATNYIYNGFPRGIMVYTNGTNNSVIGNEVHSCTQYGIHILVTSNTFVSSNKCYFNSTGIKLQGDITTAWITNNDVRGGTTAIDVTAATGVYVINGNAGYIAPGEIRTASGTLTGGAANAILFAWHNPEAQDIFIKKVIINITTADADAANIDVGIADDAVYTNGGTEFFNDLKGETIQVNDSWVTTEHTQTIWVLCQDSVSATDGWVVAKILDNDGTSIVGSYYIEFVGK